MIFNSNHDFDQDNALSSIQIHILSCKILAIKPVKILAIKPVQISRMISNDFLLTVRYGTKKMY